MPIQTRHQIRVQNNHAEMTISIIKTNPHEFPESFAHLYKVSRTIHSLKQYESWIEGPLRQAMPHRGMLSILCLRHSGGMSVISSHSSKLGDIARKIVCGPFSSLNCPYAERWRETRDVLRMERPFPNALWHEDWIVKLSACNALPGIMSGSIDNPSKSVFFFYLFGLSQAIGNGNKPYEHFAQIANAAHAAYLDAAKGYQAPKPTRTVAKRDGPKVPTQALALSDAERAITELICQGLSTKEIAKTLNKSPHTVSRQLQTAYKRNRIHTRTELAILNATLATASEADSLDRGFEASKRERESATSYAFGPLINYT